MSAYDLDYGEMDVYTEEEILAALQALPEAQLHELWTEAVTEAANERGIDPALFATFVEQAGDDISAGLEAYDAFAQQATQRFGDPPQATAEADGLAGFIAENPDFQRYLDSSGGDLDAALEHYGAWQQELLKAGQKANAEASRPRSLDEAMKQSYDEGLLGGRDRYRHRKTGDALGDAIGEFTEELSARRGVEAMARRDFDQRVADSGNDR
jgi:hypothetical protein